MKRSLFCLTVLMLAGCSRELSSTGAVYPALDQSPPPVPVAASSAPLSDTASDRQPLAVITAESGIQRRIQMEEQIESLRAYAEKAPPGDPFALTKEELDALSKLDNLVIF